jgi:hypothetical protein
MANLRELLGSSDTNFTGIHSGGIGRLREGQVTYFMANMCGSCSDYEVTACQAPAGDCTLGYNNFNYCCWKVPSYPGVGTTTITFEIWGAGGGGAGACCCAYGIPGGAGAYAYKTVTGVTSGTPYNFVIGSPTCRVPSVVGLDGCKTFVTGIGLTNFCAEGGVKGCSFCITAFPGNGKCNFKTAIGASEGFGGNNNIVGLNTACVGCCSIYYGADGGAPGLPGAYALMCHERRCFNKHYIPYPGGLVNQQGGYIIANQCENSTCGYFAQCLAAGEVGFGGHSEYNYVPGFGGPSAVVCAGGCCCGTQGWAGAVRVTVRYV